MQFNTDIGRKLFARARRVPAFFRGMNPARDWAFGIVLMLPVFVLGALYAGYRFWEVRDDRARPAAAELETAIYDHERIGTALSTYRARRDALRAVAPGAFDPSRPAPLPEPVAEERAGE